MDGSCRFHLYSHEGLSLVVAWHPKQLGVDELNVFAIAQ